MPHRDRRFVVALAAGLTLLALGCAGSDNKGRIEGKWKVLSGTDNDDEYRAREAFFTFDDEGTATFDRVPDAQTQARTPLGEKPPGWPVKWKYKLGPGGAVTFYRLPPDFAEKCELISADGDRARVAVWIETYAEPTTVGWRTEIENRKMILTGADGRTLALVRAR